MILPLKVAVQQGGRTTTRYPWPALDSASQLAVCPARMVGGLHCTLTGWGDLYLVIRTLFSEAANVLALTDAPAAVEVPGEPGAGELPQAATPTAKQRIRSRPTGRERTGEEW